MTCFFVRLKDDGCIASAIPFKFSSRAEAEAKAPVILLSRRGGGGQIALVELVAEVDVKAQVVFRGQKAKL